MKFRDVLKTAVANLTRHKARTALTTVGVVVGILTIVTMVSLGIGVQREMTRRLCQRGSGDRTALSHHRRGQRLFPLWRTGTHPTPDARVGGHTKSSRWGSRSDAFPADAEQRQNDGPDGRPGDPGHPWGPRPAYVP